MLNRADQIDPKIIAWHKDLLYDKTDRSTGCWIWTGSKRDGYGVTKVADRNMLVHRLSYILYRGEIPLGMVVRHVCPDGPNRACANPDHLKLGTQAENNRDTVRTGRWRPKQRSYYGILPSNFDWDRRLCDEKIRELSQKRRFADLDRLALRFALPRAHIELIIKSGSSAESRDFTDFERSFLTKIDVTKGCWLWRGPVVAGYGRYRVGSRTIGAHQVAWILTNGPIPRGRVVCHNCPGGDNSMCVNPQHLFIGTQRENMRDHFRKRGGGILQKEPSLFSNVLPTTHKIPLCRVPLGQASKNAKLSNEDVIKIRQLAASGWTYEKLSRRFPVSTSTIAGIVKRTAWKHIPESPPASLFS